MSLRYAFVVAIVLAGCSSSEPQYPTRTDVPVGKGPDGLILIQGDSLALVANVEDTSLSVVDLEEKVVRATIPVGQSPWGVARLGGGPQLVLSVHGVRRLVVLDADRLEVAATIELSFGPTGLAVSSDGSTAYVAGDDHRLHAFDFRGNRELRSLPVGEHPDGVALTADGSAVWVSNTSGSISVIDLASWTETRIDEPGKPEQIVSHPSRPLMFVSNYTAHTLSIYRTDTLELLHRVSGEEHSFRGPEEVRFSPDGSRFFLAAFESGAVLCFELESLRPCGRWSVGRGTIAVEVTTDKLVTTNYSDNTVSVLAIAPLPAGGDEEK